MEYQDGHIPFANHRYVLLHTVKHGLASLTQVLCCRLSNLLEYELVLVQSVVASREGTQSASKTSENSLVFACTRVTHSVFQTMCPIGQPLAFYRGCGISFSILTIRVFFITPIKYTLNLVKEDEGLSYCLRMELLDLLAKCVLRFLDFPQNVQVRNFLSLAQHEHAWDIFDRCTLDLLEHAFSNLLGVAWNIRA